MCQWPPSDTLRADGVQTEFSRSRETVEALAEGSEDVIAIAAYGLVPPEERTNIMQSFGS